MLTLEKEPHFSIFWPELVGYLASPPGLVRPHGPSFFAWTVFLRIVLRDCKFCTCVWCVCVCVIQHTRRLCVDLCLKANAEEWWRGFSTFPSNPRKPDAHSSGGLDRARRGPCWEWALPLFEEAEFIQPVQHKMSWPRSTHFQTRVFLPKFPPGLLLSMVLILHLFLFFFSSARLVMNPRPLWLLGMGS